MMMGLGVGGPAVGMFHLITHAFFKALLFLGAGSVIHGCSGEQDIRRMGGLSKSMRVTFLAYMAGMLALCGFPLFAGFWSKDFILDAAHNWSVSQVPFYFGALGALLTAFYMTRQVYYVFAGSNRAATGHDAHSDHTHAPHESPAVMTIPLVILAAFAVLLGFLGTPAWPWFQSFLEGTSAPVSFAAFFEPGIIPVMISSSLLVFLGLALGWYFYGRTPILSAESPDAVGKLQPGLFNILGHAYYVDAIYGATLIRLNTWWSHICDFFDRFIWNGAVQLVSWSFLGVAWFDSLFDTYIVNTGFDAGCGTVSIGGRILALLQGGRVQTYLRIIGCALIALVIFLLWGAKA
jgi:NADH-quinone oxidoreductase subunit L